MTQTVSRAAAWPDGATVAFPGPSGWIRLPPDRRLARSGIASWSASRPRAVAVQGAAWAAAATVGPRVLGPARPAPCPLPAADWEALAEQWRAQLGDVDGVVPLLRRQAEPSRFAVLLHRGPRRVAFVKLRRDALGTEPAVLAAAAAQRLSTITVPPLLGTGRHGAWHWFATAPLPGGVHRAGRPDLARVTADVSRVVEAALPRPAGVPAHWRGAHGDLTRWNLRRTAGRWVVFDWEDATWAPPLADRVGYAASAAAARGRRAVRLPAGLPADLADRDLSETVHWWSEVVRQRLRSAPDPSYDMRLAEVLASLLPRA